MVGQRWRQLQERPDAEQHHHLHPHSDADRKSGEKGNRVHRTVSSVLYPNPLFLTIFCPGLHNHILRPL